ncbi:hypothetical protein D1227_06255 [Henriciella mobilis]|uniref:hypothetical protein n=1 Tax=Henriciella mobilis TaxID=2305467 RepID=UPI000E6656DB|nr:hypothetical protein [Henriciella mobilis]RIJ15986.1 hypothetical protein D1231_09345 [Henriciella mobilis]RIJ21196.1 hypothetical protein D1227_12885 [Henriciella mobilis]RIJ23103.1 hypothetical protein D1227_06255 [Henriciella mobilis]
MRAFGIFATLASAAAFFVGAMMYFAMDRPTKTDLVLLESAQSLLDLCESGRALDRYTNTTTYCTKERIDLERRRDELPSPDPALVMTGLALMSAAPFFFLVGCIFLAAGNLQKTVLSRLDGKFAEK